MASFSILFAHPHHHGPPGEAPPCLHHLHLDQVIEAVTRPKEEYNLKPVFFSPLQDAEEVQYRQEVIRDLEDPGLLKAIKTFVQEMKTVHDYLALGDRLDSPHQQRGWFLEAVLLYCHTLHSLTQEMENLEPRSRGIKSLKNYLSQYLASSPFQGLGREAREVKEGLSQVKFCLIIQEGKFKVKRYQGEEDYSTQVEKTFEKFKEHEVEAPEVKGPRRRGTSHIEAKILEFVSKLHPEPFAALDKFWSHHRDFLDENILSFEREVQFYLAYLDFITPLKEKGLPFCLPQVSTTDKEEEVKESFDLALAHSSDRSLVLNDYSLRGTQRILVVTGPNQGGKTTFARMFGQIHYLASLGLPVPGKKARLFLGNAIFTHFGKEESIADLRGKLEDDLVRIHDMLGQANPRSIFVVNEIFSSTTFQDALFLGREILNRIMELDALAVWVTFTDELASLGEKTVSMVATVDPLDPTVRTFRIIQRPADGIAYALSLAQKHRLTYQEIKERIKG